MVVYSLQYVASIVAPALLVAVAVDALRRSRRDRWIETCAWIVAAIALLCGAVFPDTLSWGEDLLGISIPRVAVVGIGVAALALGYGIQAQRVSALESQLDAMRREGDAVNPHRRDASPGA